MTRVSLTEDYDDRSVISKLNEMDKRVKENASVVTSAEESARQSAQSAQETADRFAGSVGAVVQNANQQINASKVLVDQAKAEVDETVTTVAQAVQTANQASASVQQSATTVATYGTRLTAVEDKAQGNSADIDHLEIETRDLYDRDANNLKLHYDHPQNVEGAVSYASQQTKAVPDLAMDPYFAYGRMQSIPCYIAQLGPSSSAYYGAMEVSYRYETLHLHFEINTNNEATTLKHFGTQPSAMINSVRFGVLVKDGSTYLVYYQTQNNVNSMIRVKFVQRSTSSAMVVPAKMDPTQVEESLRSTISWFEPIDFQYGVTPGEGAPSTAIVTKAYVESTDGVTNNILHKTGNEDRVSGKINFNRTARLYDHGREFSAGYTNTTDYYLYCQVPISGDLRAIIEVINLNLYGVVRIAHLGGVLSKNNVIGEMLSHVDFDITNDADGIHRNIWVKRIDPGDFIVNGININIAGVRTDVNVIEGYTKR